METRSSAPANAYEACERAVAMIRASRRYDQRWFTRAGDCGTVYCRGGWIVVAVDGEGPVISAAGELWASFRAYEILGAAGDADHDYRLAVSLLFCPDFNPGAVRTNVDPEWGAAGLEAFMAQHEARLRATPVAPVGWPA